MIFLNSVSSAAALVFYLLLSRPFTQRWKTERGQSPEYVLKFSKKNTVFNEHSVPEGVHLQLEEVHVWRVRHVVRSTAFFALASE